MKRIFVLLTFLMILFLIPSIGMAGGCAGFSGECFAPKEDNTGRIGTDGWEWQYGYFETIIADTDAQLPSGSIGATEIADVTRTIYFDIAGAFVDGGNDVDDGSAPNITTLDNIPAILWDDSTETAAVQWTFPVPADYSSGMVVYAMISSDEASGAATILDWALTKNATATGFASPTAQTQVAATSATLDVSNEVLTLTPDATGLALFVDNAIITLEVFNASTNDDDLELKAIWAEYSATQ